MREKTEVNYTTFGAPLPGRSFSSANYRYGFNGKENDPESVGTGEGLQDYGFRIYNPSLGKFLSVDPLTQSYPMLTPYQFAANSPIKFIDRDGLEPASKEEKEKAIKKVNDHEVDSDYSHAFVNITFNRFITDLKEAINNPGSMKFTDHGYYCGLMVISYVVAYHDPVAFADATLGLFERGGAYIYGMALEASPRLKKGCPTEGTNVAGWIFGSVLCERTNLSWNYQNPGKGPKWWSSTSYTQMLCWLLMMDYDVRYFKGYSYAEDGVEEDHLPGLKAWIDAGYSVVMLVGYEQFKYGEHNPIDGDIWGGDHWIVLSGKFEYSLENNTVSFEVYDREKGYESRTMQLDVFMDMVNGAMLIRKNQRGTGKESQKGAGSAGDRK